MTKSTKSKRKKKIKKLSKKELKAKARRARRARNLVFIRTYGITSKERDRRCRHQRNRCKICGNSHNAKGELLTLHVDHDHKWRQVKISYKKKDKWRAKATYCKMEFRAKGRTKSEVSKIIKQKLKRRSVRGLICWQCNRALRVWNDNVERMRAGAVYLEGWKKHGAF